MRSNRFTFERGKDLLAMKANLGISNQQLSSLYERHSDGSKTGYILSRYNIGKFERARKKFWESLNKEYDLSEDPFIRTEQIKGNPEIGKRISSWYKENTQPVEGWKEIIENQKKNLSEYMFDEWYDANVGVSSRGKEYPKGSLAMPSKVYVNDKFYDMAKNKKLYELYDMLLSLKEQDLNKQPLANRSLKNLYKLPQISKSLIERIKANSSVFKELPELLKDEFTSRVDDEMFEEGTDIVAGRRINYVPIRFNRMLENTDDISEDILGLYIAYGDMSENFKGMSEIAPTLELIKDKMSKSRFKIKNGKEQLGAETQAYKALDKFLSVHLYGGTKEKIEIKLGKNKDWKLNVTKVMNKLYSYIRANNLVGNVFTILTNYLSGGLMSRIERYAGQYSTTESGNWAFTEFSGSVGRLMGDVGRANKTDIINNMFALHGVFNSARDEFKNSNKSAIGRVIEEHTFYGLYSLGDYSIKGVMTLSIWDNFRLYKGEWHTRNSFINQHYKEDYKTGLSEWSKLRDKSYYNAWEMKGNKPVVKKEFKKFINDDVIDLMSSKVQSVNSEIDGQINEFDKGAMFQSVFFSALGIHRGWLFQGVQKRLKKKGFNYATGEMEEGTYRTVSKHFWEFMKAVFHPQLRKLQFENWKDLDDYEKANLLRAVYEMRVAALCYATALLFSAIATSDDDEDDYWLAQSAAYLSNRLLMETSVFIPPFVISEGLNTFKNPVAGINQIDQIKNLFTLFGDDSIRVGPYKGLNRKQKAMIKLSPGLKGWFEAADPESKNRFMRMQALDWWPGL
jgi:hypothetical protein